MNNSWKNCVKVSAIQAAFVAISSRIVGSAFRCLETLNPQYKQSNVGNDPKTVCIREMSTISMAWGFALLTSALIKDRLTERHWGEAKIQFLTSVIGTLIAESVGRLIAYRKLYRRNTDLLPHSPDQVSSLNALHVSAGPVALPQAQPGRTFLPQNLPYQTFPVISPFH